MALAPWRPFGEMNILRREIDRLLERPYGAFVRMGWLPAPVAQDKIKASGKNGGANG